MIEDEEIQTLMDLGLSLLQAKTYLALAALGTATIKSVAKTAKMAKQDIYRIMPTLQKMGLAEKVLTTPASYKVTPLKSGVSILLQRRAHEYSELQKKTEKLLNHSHGNNLKAALYDEDSQFVITSEETLLFKKFEKGNQTAQKSIDTVGKWEGIKAALFYVLQEEFKKVMEKGIRIRIITEQHESDQSMLKILRVLKKNPLFGIRYLPNPIPVKTVIYDEKEVNMCIAIPLDRDVPSLWSNNPNFVKIMVTHFEEMWNIACEEETEKPFPSSNKS